MIKKLIHIIIIYLVLFQNVWAIDQTYRTFCDSLQVSHNSEQYSEIVLLDKQAIHHEHSCTHGSAPFVGITLTTNKTDRQYTETYYSIVIQHLTSVVIQPPIPPPTFEKVVNS